MPKVAAILRPISPDLPMPVMMSLPRLWEDHLYGLDEVLVERPFHFFERVGFGTE